MLHKTLYWQEKKIKGKKKIGQKWEKGKGGRKKGDKKGKQGAKKGKREWEKGKGEKGRKKLRGQKARQTIPHLPPLPRPLLLIPTPHPLLKSN